MKKKFLELSRWSSTIFIVLCISMLSVPCAQAELITFNGLAGTDIEGINDIIVPGSHTQFFIDGSLPVTSTVAGFSFTSIAHCYIGYVSNDGDYYMPYNGTDFLESDGRLTITAANGSLLSLFSVDLGNWRDDPNDINHPANKKYVITGYYFGGGSTSQTITLDGTYNRYDDDGNDFEHFTFTDFTNLTSLTIDGLLNPINNFVIDNLNVSSAPVPEPATMLLLGSGLAGLAAFRRRMKAREK